MSLNCLGPDGTYRSITWRYIKKGWVPAITVCTERLYNYNHSHIGSDSSMTYGIIDVTSSENVTLEPIYNRTIIRFTGPIDYNMNISVNTTNCNIGDELIMFTSFVEGGMFTLSNDNFYFPIAEETVDGWQFSRLDNWAMYFVFDGELFSSTTEHC